MRDNLAVDHAALDGFADITAKILRGEVDRKMGPLSADVVQIRRDFDAHVGDVVVLDGRVSALEARATADTQYTNRFIDKIEAIEARVARLDAVEADLKSAAEALEDLKGKFDRQEGVLETTRQQGSALDERQSASENALTHVTGRIDEGEAAIKALMQADTQTNVRIGEVKAAIGEVQVAVDTLKDLPSETLAQAQMAIEALDDAMRDQIQTVTGRVEAVEDLHKSVAQAADAVEDIAVAANRMAQEARQGHESNAAAIEGLSAQVEALVARPEPVGIARTFIDNDGNLLITKTNGDIEVPGPVKGKDGQPGNDGKDGKDGQDGADGFALADFNVLQLDERRVRLEFKDDHVAKSFDLDFPVMIYRGVYQTEKGYLPGDVVTWGGSAWTCKNATGDAPKDASSDWQLSVKRGRDGKGAPN